MKYYRLFFLATLVLVSPLKAIALDVEMTNVVECPFFISTTSVSNTEMQFEFLFSWVRIAPLEPDWDFSEPECCSHIGQQVRIIEANVPIAIFTTHYLNPSGKISQDLVNQITNECPEYIGSGEIWTSPCMTKLATSRPCLSENTLIYNEITDSKTPIKDEAIGVQELIQHKDDKVFNAKFRDDMNPMLVKDELFVSNETFNANSGKLSFKIDAAFKEKHQKLPYFEQTKIKTILMKQDCKLVNSYYVTSNAINAPAISYNFSCPNGNVSVFEESLKKYSKHSQEYNNKILLNNNLAAGMTFYKNQYDERNSSISVKKKQNTIKNNDNTWH